MGTAATSNLERDAGDLPKKRGRPKGGKSRLGRFRRVVPLRIDGPIPPPFQTGQQEGPALCLPYQAVAVAIGALLKLKGRSAVPDITTTWMEDGIIWQARMDYTAKTVKITKKAKAYTDEPEITRYEPIEMERFLSIRL